ncbi:kinase-like protein [Corynespora cassiicola Philippines]|uniref:non-specific serine/threonine protein kinase n=1 Tax=Corynespora cassiicola Philippines TaxID=1448308 RepID=A0A2T2NJU8_CORCC|nr:kinase-like protein [Corynespora cassiicola Philippines]
MLHSRTPFRRGEHADIANRRMLPFRYIERLGMGMSAVVEVVEDKVTGQRFAHKAFRQYYGAEPEKFKQSFRNEIKIIKQLRSHPHIIQVYWSYTCDNEFGMLLTPIAHDGDLRAYLRAIQNTGKSPTPEQHAVLCRSFGCLASGLAFIHSHTIRHKDIKPQNILVHNGQMIYTDFGIALDASEQDTTTTGRPEAFTDRYYAPEVADWEPRNRKSDVFSLGCVFVEIMALLTSDADLGVSDSRPYWHRVNDMQITLMNISMSDPRLDSLLLVCHDMLEPTSSDRIEAEVLLHRIRSIEGSYPNLTYQLFCENCEGHGINAPDSVTDDEKVAASSGESQSSQDDIPRPETLIAADSFQTNPVEKAIRQLAQKPIRGSIRHEGHIFLFWRLQNPDLLHISSAINVPQRLRVWERTCKYPIKEYEQQNMGKRMLVKNALRVLRLVYTELMPFRRREYCEGCHNVHRQWFRTSPEHAAKVIKKFSDWMATDPYFFYQETDRWILDDQAWETTVEVCKQVRI